MSHFKQENLARPWNALTPTFLQICDKTSKKCKLILLQFSGIQIETTLNLLDITSKISIITIFVIENIKE